MGILRGSTVAAIVVGLVAVLATAHWWSLAGDFDTEQVVARAFESSTRSWEFGTLAQALLELRNPELTVFGTQPFPNGHLPKIPEPNKVEGLRYAKAVIWTNQSNLLIDGEGRRARALAVSFLWKSQRNLLSASCSYILQVHHQIRPR